MDTLQKNNYDLAKAMSTLVPQGGPVLCRDEMEEWSASEAMLFEEALEKYGKDFNDIRQDFVSSFSPLSLTVCRTLISDNIGVTLQVFTVDTHILNVVVNLSVMCYWIELLNWMWISGSIDVFFLSLSCPGSLWPV